jgi:hypothetical protein
MNSPVSIEELASAVKQIYRSDVSQAETLIEKYLEERLQGASPLDKLAHLERLCEEFRGAAAQEPSSPESQPEVVAKLFSLFLGKKVSESDLSSNEFLERLAGSLNTVFDSLNEIVGVINATLLGKQAELETIRQIIGTDLHDELGGSSLEDYLAQIKKAFLASHQAFKEAAEIQVRQILHELDPHRLAETEAGGLKIGALKKAGLFEVYQERFQKVQNWFSDGRFTEELLREFEKSCQRFYR